MYRGVNAPPETFHAHQELLNRFYYGIDCRDWDLMGSVFTEDVYFVTRDMVAPGRPGPDLFRAEGRAAIQDLIGGPEGTLAGLAATHHMLGNHALEVSSDGASARGSCYLRAYHAGSDERAHLFEESLGYVEYETVRTAQGWKICRFEKSTFARAGTNDVFPGRDRKLQRSRDRVEEPPR
jgi:hypothetical protein